MNWASLPDGEDWLMAPVVEGMIKMESLTDGTVTLWHLALANDALSVRAENRRRETEAR